MVEMHPTRMRRADYPPMLGVQPVGATKGLNGDGCEIAGVTWTPDSADKPSPPGFVDNG